MSSHLRRYGPSNFLFPKFKGTYLYTSIVWSLQIWNISALYSSFVSVQLNISNIKRDYSLQTLCHVYIRASNHHLLQVRLVFSPFTPITMRRKIKHEELQLKIPYWNCQYQKPKKVYYYNNRRYLKIVMILKNTTYECYTCKKKHINRELELSHSNVLPTALK